MLVYFDESYDTNHTYLLLGALFNPHPRYLHRELKKTKKEMGFMDRQGKYLEIKYNNCTSNKRAILCKNAIDIFMKSTSYFRAIVIEQDKIDLNKFGNRSESKELKMAKAYKKFAEMLISSNTKNIYNGVLLTDELTRCKGDMFIEVMKREFCESGGKHCDDPNRPTLKDIRDFPSDIETYHVNQINDILLGCILNNNIPTTKNYKNDLRKYLIEKLGVPSLLQSYWGQFSKKQVEEQHPKYNIWYWHPKEN